MCATFLINARLTRGRGFAAAKMEAAPKKKRVGILLEFNYEDLEVSEACGGGF